MSEWQNGISAPRTGEVIIAAWPTLWNARRGWRYRLIMWDELSGHWTVCPAVIGKAWQKKARGGRHGVWPLQDGTLPERVPLPAVWKPMVEPPDKPLDTRPKTGVSRLFP